MASSACNLYLEQADIALVLQLVKAGDGEAFAELVRRYDGMVRRRAYSILKSTEDAEDATQETFVRVYSKLETFKGNAAFSTWLTRVVINICLMRLRTKRSRPAISLDELTDGDKAACWALMDSSPDPERQCATRELSRKLDEAIYRLPVILRNVVVDQIYEDVSVRDAAKKRGISVAAAKSRMYRARKMLQCALPDLRGPYSKNCTVAKR